MFAKNEHQIEHILEKNMT